MLRVILILCALLGGAYVSLYVSLPDTPTHVEALPWPFPPKPPKPPEPVPPLNDDDSRLLDRLFPRIDQRIQERALAKIDEQLIQVASELDRPMNDDELNTFAKAIERHNDGVIPQGFVAAIVASAIAKLVKKIVWAILTAMFVTMLGAILWQYKWWIGTIFVTSVTLIAWPAGWSAGKLSTRKTQ